MAELLYTSGEEVHAGDRVQFSGLFATVVFVTDGEVEEFVPGYDEFTGTDRGVTLKDDDGELIPVGEPDERLEFLSRG